MMATAPHKPWGVTFAGATISFSTRAEAKRFIRINHQDVADRRGGTFKAVIVRIPVPKEAIH